jgi:hypothetical protein
MFLPEQTNYTGNKQENIGGLPVDGIYRNIVAYVTHVTTLCCVLNVIYESLKMCSGKLLLSVFVYYSVVIIIIMQ